MPLAGSYLDRDGLKKQLGPARAALVDGDFFDPSGTWTDATKVARRVAWREFVDTRLVTFSQRIESRLRKRYVCPFDAPTPPAIAGWLAEIMKPDLYEGMGWIPSDEQAEDLRESAATAWAEIKEAADAENGLFDLPLRADTTESGIVRGGPLGYSEASPYEWLDRQRESCS